MTDERPRRTLLDRELAKFSAYRRKLAERREKIRRQATPSRRIGKRGVLVAILLVVVGSGLGLMASPAPAVHLLLRTNQSSPRAVLIDSLSLTDPDPQFVQNVTHALSAAGYSLDYYGPSQVTVNLFRNLALQNYRLIMIRSHTATYQGVPTSLSIVTSEPYSKSKYVYEQLVGQVAPATVRPGYTFFSITPAFVESAITGGFQDAIVIQMGCSALLGNHDIATAFIDKGASAFIGWDNLVSSWYTDLSTQNVVTSILHGHTVREAVSSAGGPDPGYGGQLGSLDAASTSQARLNGQLTTIIGWIALFSVTLAASRRLVRDR